MKLGAFKLGSSLHQVESAVCTLFSNQSLKLGAFSLGSSLHHRCPTEVARLQLQQALHDASDAARVLCAKQYGLTQATRRLIGHDAGYNHNII